MPITDLDEYYEAMIPLRDQLKNWLNIMNDMTDLNSITQAKLETAGLSTAKAAWEMTRLNFAKDVWSALVDFDNASS